MLYLGESISLVEMDYNSNISLDTVIRYDSTCHCSDIDCCVAQKGFLVRPEVAGSGPSRLNGLHK